MSAADGAFDVAITRTTVVRVSGTADQDSSGRLDRILRDLIQNHGIRDLAVDLSGTDHLGPGIAKTLEGIQALMEQLDGCLLVRTPIEPPDDLVELAEDVSTFVRLEPDPERRNG